MNRHSQSHHEAVAETTSGRVYRADVKLFTAVHTIPFATLKDIICTHYGAEQFDAEWQRVLGKKDEAVRDIMVAYKDIPTKESVSKGSAESTTSQPEPAEPFVIVNATIEAADSLMKVNEAMNDYLEAYKCNTTHSCHVEAEEIKRYDVEYNSEDEYEYDESDYCSDQDDHRYVSAPDQGEVTQEVECGHQVLLEDETDEKPGVQEHVPPGEKRGCRGILEEKTGEEPRVEGHATPGDQGTCQGILEDENEDEAWVPKRIAIKRREY